MQDFALKLTLAVVLAVPVAAVQLRGAAANSDPGAEIAALIRANNDAEIDSGNAAARKASAKEVKDFGRLMVEHHTASNAQLKASGIKPLATPAVEAAKRKAAEDKRRLERVPEDQFDALYVSQQVAAHRALLEALDGALADREALGASAALIQRTRAVVEDHLLRATRLQSTLRR